MKKYIIQTLAAVFIAGGLLVAFREQLIRVWAAPQKIETVEEAIKETTTVQKQLAQVVTAQQTQIEIQQVETSHQKEINALQIEALKEYVKELKK